MTLNKMTWNTAAAWCTTNGGRIAQDMDMSEVAALTDLITRNMRIGGDVLVSGFEEHDVSLWLGAVRNLDGASQTEFVWIDSGEKVVVDDDAWEDLSNITDANCMGLDVYKDDDEMGHFNFDE